MRNDGTLSLRPSVLESVRNCVPCLPTSVGCANILVIILLVSIVVYPNYPSLIHPGIGHVNRDPYSDVVFTNGVLPLLRFPNTLHILEAPGVDIVLCDRSRAGVLTSVAKYSETLLVPSHRGQWDLLFHVARDNGLAVSVISRPPINALRPRIPRPALFDDKKRKGASFPESYS